MAQKRSSSIVAARLREPAVGASRTRGRRELALEPHAKPVMPSDEMEYVRSKHAVTRVKGEE
ncbi:hypothetical protein PACILC2_08180 [Paenibacillus cisolokensis]|uniref:Uncharacterized protein n=1 Tax=Paenibacillus cisolokensis TaxID=1658519 RepID=A0ABQ4N251_9BACL|nr:hypothetical protein PACILC2_08180 [Paenibacillus cisolokensis]